MNKWLIVWYDNTDKLVCNSIVENMTKTEVVKHFTEISKATQVIINLIEL